MAIEYPVQLKLELKPVGRPWVRVALDEYQQTRQLETLTTFEWLFDATDEVCLTVEHFDKQDTDPDTAVEIMGIEFFGISDPRFAWQGVYRPEYPATWYAEQTVKPLPELLGQTYLGWNGIYSLRFTVPVFTWMHQVQNLGWIYS